MDGYLPDNRRTIRNIYWLTIGIPLAAFLLFIPSFYVKQWDEARLAMNAIEMIRNGNWLVTYFEGGPDMWSTKPPLMIWLIALSFKLFGYTEFALRLPSVIAACLTFFMLLHFSHRYLDDLKLGIIAVFILFTAPGFSGYHVALSGDYDAWLVCCITFYVLSWFKYLEKGMQKDLWLFFAGLTAAVLTKGVSGLLMLPAIALYSIYKNKIGVVLKDKWFYAGSFLALLFISGYYILREQQNPGYWSAVVNNELGGRYFTVLEDHRHPWYFYIQNMFGGRFLLWSFLLTTSFLILPRIGNRTRKDAAVLFALCVIIFLLIISFADTKLRWYDAPVYPFAAVLSAMVVQSAVEKLKSLAPQRNRYKKAGFVLIGMFFTAAMIHTVLTNKRLMEIKDNEEMYAPYLTLFGEKYPEIKAFTIVADAYHPEVSFYKEKLGREGYRIIVSSFHELKGTEEIILTSDPEIAGQIKALDQLSLLDSNRYGQAFYRDN